MHRISEQHGAEQQLLRDCRVLFGPGPRITPGFLAYLRISGVKSAFRQRALETHPDVLCSLEPANRPVGDADFITVRRAFENLSSYIKRRETFPFMAAQAAAAPAGRRPSPGPGGRRPGPSATPGGGGPGGRPSHDTDRLYRGTIPDRRLLLGHFLYYAGLVSWRAIAQGLIWQRSSRPRLGELARRRGWLTDEHIRAVLEMADLRQPFGRSAIDLALLSESQCRHLLMQQQRMQKRIGRFFIESGWLTAADFGETITRFHLHNAGTRGPAGRRAGPGPV